MLLEFHIEGRDLQSEGDQCVWKQVSMKRIFPRFAPMSTGSILGRLIDVIWESSIILD